MSEFICGAFFFAAGVALLIYNKSMVEGSSEFHRAMNAREEEEMIFFNRVLCVLAGLMTSFIGYLTMLSSR